jgi:cysteinyl-tRNA synthetase
MSLTVYNYLTRRMEEFRPLHEGRVTMYVCGPTVYSHSHIGHAKAYISFDVIVRYLRHLGYTVRYVRNITDVGHLTDDADQGEDKIARQARIDRVEPMELVEKYMWSYFEDMEALNVLRADINPRPSAHIPEQIELVRRLIEKGYAYEVNGSVYFSVERFPEYGKLSRRRVEDQQEGARVEVNPDKRHPADFAVWIKAEPGHIMRWPSPWSEGYPGWHLECSVMAIKYLGETIDIHGGGLENMFPHNESEIAQAEAATGKPFVRYWLLNNMVTVDGTKMGKSLGNYITIKDALQRHHPMALRAFILTTHYRSNTDFSEAAIQAAAKGLERLWNLTDELDQRLARAPQGPAGDQATDLAASIRAGFHEAMDNDFNTPRALAALHDGATAIHKLLAAPQNPITRGDLELLRHTYRETMENVLGIRPRESTDTSARERLDALIAMLVELRAQARAEKNWALADRIRDRLREIGIELKDGRDGTTWSIL